MDHLTALPTELLFHITSFIEPDDLVALLSVNRYLRELSREIWAASLKQLSLKYPKCLDPLDSDVLEEISDLKKFYCLVIRKNKRVLGDWVKSDKSRRTLSIRVNLELGGIIGFVNYDCNTPNEKDVNAMEFFAPIDLEACNSDMKKADCTKCGDGHTCDIQFKIKRGLLYVGCTYLNHFDNPLFSPGFWQLPRSYRPGAVFVRCSCRKSCNCVLGEVCYKVLRLGLP